MIITAFISGIQFFFFISMIIVFYPETTSTMFERWDLTPIVKKQFKFESPEILDLIFL